MAEFIITTDRQNRRVNILTNDDENPDFIDWMMACEFFIKKTAQLSPAGYEKALELLCKGSMEYKMTEEECPNG